MIVAFDLAAVRAGLCIRSGRGQVLAHAVSDSKVTIGALVTLPFRTNPTLGMHVVAEDQPPGIRDDSTKKRAYRIQGRLIYLCEYYGVQDLTWIQPALWQRHFKIFQEQKWAAVDLAEARGWSRPDKQNPPVRTSQKSLFDLADAYLISEWAIEMLAEHGTFETIKGVNDYTRYR